MPNGFLPINKQELMEDGITQPDFVYVSGDAYVDHSSFGTAIICRLLQARGYSVALICQPDWRDPASVQEYGEPRLGFLVSSGNMDSMVNHYTVAKKRRHQDAYSPGGAIGKRPDYAVIVYCNLIRRTYKRTPIIIGGIEASLRRLSHYDYWSDKVRRSILLDSGADLISYGMGEHSIPEIADALASGLDVRDITYIDGTVYKTRDEESIYDAIRLPDFEQVKGDKHQYAYSFSIQHGNTDPFQAKRLYEAYDGKLFVVQNPPAKPLTTQEMDDVYALPFKRAYHPSYEKDGGIPALSEIKFSLTSNRGCFGDCNFCAYIHDVGGPTAEFRRPACDKQLTQGACKHRRCLYPKPCPNLKVDHSDYLALLRKLRALPGVKRVFVRSGFRFDYLLADKDRTFLRELCEYHVSGQLRVAPEHISDNVLSKMGKPDVNTYNAFCREFDKMNKKLHKNQYIVPYLMSSHPGSTMKDAIALAEYIRDLGYMPEQVQDFYPTPGTISTCMYYTGLDPTTLKGDDPSTMKTVYVPRDPHEKAMQRALIQYRDPKNYALVKEALLREGREDLIGYGEGFLIPPREWNTQASRGKASGAGTQDDKPSGNRSTRGKSAGNKGPGKGTRDRSSSGRDTRKRTHKKQIYKK